MGRVFPVVSGTTLSPAIPAAAYPSNSKISPAASASMAVTGFAGGFPFFRRNCLFIFLLYHIKGGNTGKI
jgi:hypothetical protein